MGLLRWLKSWLRWEDDPLRVCELYKDEGCPHVDGMLCNVHTCRERKEHVLKKLTKRRTNAR